MIYIGFEKCSECGGDVETMHDDIYYCAICAEKNLKRCSVCGDVFDISVIPYAKYLSSHNIQIKTWDDEYICPDCIESEGFYVCEDCGLLVHPDDIIYIDNLDKNICPECDEIYCACDLCGDVFHNDDTQNGPGNDVLCIDCYENKTFECADCGEREYNENSVYVVGLGNICKDCYENYYGCCDECGEVYYQDQLHYLDDTGEYFCENCFNQSNEYIHDYSYKPIPKFFGENNKNRFYGIELEVDNGSDVPEEILTDEIYLKHDGSLDCGFEIVTHPMSYKYIMDNMGWEDMFEAVLKYGYRSHDTNTCGLHIHISQKAFGETPEDQDFYICKLINFFEFNWERILKLSRRTQNQVDRWAARYGIDNKFRKKSDAAGNRYRAINCCNENTIEVRIFRGTLNINTFIATIQFLDSLMDFITLTNLLSWKNYIQFIKQRSDMYGELIEYLNVRKIEEMV